jgi:hypothetical protein
MKLSLFPLTVMSGLALGQFSAVQEINATFAPVPAASSGLPIPASGYLTVPLGSGAYVVLDGSCL